MTYTSHIEREVSASHSNGPPDQKCHRLHGHDFIVIVETSYGQEDLDKWGWGPNFAAIKAVIDSVGDHQNLNEIMPLPASAENIARYLLDLIIARTGFMPDFVSVREGHGNLVTYRP